MNLSITYTKAVGIILMVLGHAIFIDLWQINTFFGMLRMPLFFFCAGYCFKERYVTIPVGFVMKRIKGIYWPYLKWSLVFLVMHNIMFNSNIYNGLYGYKGTVSALYTQQDFLVHAKNILIRMGGHEELLGGFWFLKALFYGSIFSYVVISVSRYVIKGFQKTKAHNMLDYLTLIQIGCGVLLMLCAILNYKQRSLTFLSITPQLFLAAIFFLAGHMFKCKEVSKFRLLGMLVSFVAVAVGSVFWRIEMGEPFYDNLKMIPYIVTAILGTWAVYSMPYELLSQRLQNFLRFTGENTFAILTWHFLSFKIVSLIIIYIYDLPIERLAEFPVITEYAVKGWFVAYFIVGVAVPLMINYTGKKILSLWEK